MNVTQLLDIRMNYLFSSELCKKKIMEELRNQPVSFSGGNAGTPFVMPGYGANFGGGGDILGTLGMLALLSGRGLGAEKCGFNFTGPALVEASALDAAKSFADVRHDTAETASEIRESIHTQTLGLMGEFRGLDCKFSGLQRDSLAGKYEGIIAALQSNFALSNKIDSETNRLSLENRALQTSMDKQFCDLTHRLDNGLKELEVRSLNSKIEDLQRAEANHRFRDLEQMIAGLARVNNCNTPTIQMPIAVVPCVEPGTNLLKK